MEMVISEKTSYQMIYNVSNTSTNDRDFSTNDINLFMQSLGDDFLTKIQNSAGNLNPAPNLNSVKQEIFETNQNEYEVNTLENYEKTQSIATKDKN